jgi:hypothetical protein
MVKLGFFRSMSAIPLVDSSQHIQEIVNFCTRSVVLKGLMLMYLAIQTHTSRNGTDFKKHAVTGLVSLIGNLSPPESGALLQKQFQLVSNQ